MLLKVKMKVTQDEGCTHYEYPLEYDATKIQVMVYGGTGETEYCIGYVSESDAQPFLKSADIVEVTRDNALIFGNKYTTQVQKITDQNAVLTICAKAASGIKLTKEELKVLDPNDPTPGINLSRSFQAVLDEAISNL